MLPMACALVALVSAGCSIDGAGIGVSRRYYANADGSGTAVEIGAAGVSIRTAPIDRGMTLGWARRTYLLPGNLPPGTDPPSSDDGAVLRPVDPFDWRPRDVLAVNGRTGGLSVDVSRSRLGLSLGIRQRAVLRMDGRASRWVYIQQIPGQAMRLAVKEASWDVEQSER